MTLSRSIVPSLLVIALFSTLPAVCADDDTIVRDLYQERTGDSRQSTAAETAFLGPVTS